MTMTFRGTVMLTFAAVSKQVVGPCAPPEFGRALFSAIAAGDRRATQALYLRHKCAGPPLCPSSRRRRLIGQGHCERSLPRSVAPSGRFKAKSQVSTWILAIARYKALSALRSRTDEHFDEDEAAAIADPADNAEAIMDHQDRNAIIRSCLSQLSAIHHEVLDLVYYHEKSVDEVAQIVGVPASTVKTADVQCAQAHGKPARDGRSSVCIEAQRRGPAISIEGFE